MGSLIKLSKILEKKQNSDPNPWGAISKVVLWFETSDMTFERLVEMFEGDFADMFANKFLLMSMGG